MTSTPSEGLPARDGARDPQDRVAELALTVAGDPGDAEDLARADPQRHVAETHPAALGAGRDPGQLEHGEIADLPAAARANAAELALEHHLDEDLLGRLGTEKRARDAALAEHRDPVGAPEDVLHPVGDQHDRVPVGAEASERAEERRDLVLREHARRFVQDQDPGVGQQELEKLDLLLLPDGKSAHAGLGIDLEPVAGGKLPDAVADLTPFRDQSQVREEERDVLGHGEGRYQPKILEHHADRVPAGVVRRADAHRRPVHANLAAVGSVHAVEHLHERALARTVLAEEGMDLAPVDVEIDLLVGDDPGESFDHAAHGYDGEIVRPLPGFFH